jgi:ABC-type amino acid transport substrate-binding protein
MRRVVLCLLLLFASATFASARTLQEVRDRGYLIIGTSGTAPPYSWVNKRDELIGYDIDLGTAIGRSLGLPVRWKRIDFRGLLPALSTGQLDLVMSAARIRPQLRNAFLFSAPYSYEETVAITRASDKGVHAMQDMRGRTVAVVATSFQEDVAKAIGGYTDLLSLPNGTDVFLALHTGHASVGIVGITAANHYAKFGKDPINIIQAGAPLAAQGIVIGKNSPELKAAIDRILAARRADGSYQALYRKHFGTNPER